MCILRKPKAPRKACVSFLSGQWGHGSYFINHICWKLSCHFTPRNWISWAGPLTLFCLMTKTAFRRIWIIFSPFSKMSSAMLPHTVRSLIHCKCSGTSSFPVQSGSVHRKWWDCASTPDAVSSKYTAHHHRWQQTVACTLLLKKREKGREEKGNFLGFPDI